jgi:catechol 2,3-dioxygenase-like lactoylglutathione lyase family enzyme
MNWCSLVPELTVFDFGRSKFFYVDILGFEIRYQRSGPDFAYLEFEGAQVMIEEYHAEGWNIDEMVAPLGRGVSFQIECTDSASLASKIKGSDVSLFREIEVVWYEANGVLVGNKQFLVQDPDGYVLRFTEDMGERRAS